MNSSKHSIVAAGIASVMAIGSASDGGWRADLRAQMHPPTSVTAVLDSMGTALSYSIGENEVLLTWDGDELQLEVNSEEVTDLEQWNESEDPVVLAFSAYVGQGTLGPDNDAGLLGWVYIDDVGQLRVELEIPQHFIIYQIGNGGPSSPTLQAISTCRCGSYQPPPFWGCTTQLCEQGGQCPQSTSNNCGLVIPVSSQLFVATFDDVVS